MKSSDPYVPLDYELLVRGEGEETPRVVYDTYSFGMTVPQYNLELFQSGGASFLKSSLLRLVASAGSSPFAYAAVCTVAAVSSFSFPQPLFSVAALFVS